jgi:hypothetical protein
MLQLLTEAFLLSVAGGVAGIVIAHWTLYMLTARLTGEAAIGRTPSRRNWTGPCSCSAQVSRSSWDCYSACIRRGMRRGYSRDRH